MNRGRGDGSHPSSDDDGKRGEALWTGTVADFLLEITWPQEGMHSVYLQRPFELRIIPRDSDGNAIDTLLRVRLTARFPGEFDAVSRGYFQFPFEINGPTSIMLTPSFARDSAREQHWRRAAEGDGGKFPSYHTHSIRLHQLQAG